MIPPVRQSGDDRVTGETCPIAPRRTLGEGPVNAPNRGILRGGFGKLGRPVTRIGDAIRFGPLTHRNCPRYSIAACRRQGRSPPHPRLSEIEWPDPTDHVRRWRLFPMKTQPWRAAPKDRIHE